MLRAGNVTFYKIRNLNNRKDSLSFSSEEKDISDDIYIDKLHNDGFNTCRSKVGSIRGFTVNIQMDFVKVLYANYVVYIFRNSGFIRVN